jgi:hypothetical protein
MTTKGGLWKSMRNVLWTEGITRFRRCVENLGPLTCGTRAFGNWVPAVHKMRFRVQTKSGCRGRACPAPTIGLFGLRVKSINTVLTAGIQFFPAWPEGSAGYSHTGS